jgi:RecA/RadA recombinase
VIGALAIAPLPAESAPSVEREIGRVHSTGFAALDAILGSGGLPRGTFAALRGDLSSGRTTLALRLVAAAQASGAIAAWLDLAAAFDPVEAATRGVRPEWLVVLTPTDLDEGLAMAGVLLAGRAVDLLVVDLAARSPDDRSPTSAARVGERLSRLAALGRRAGISIAVLEPDLAAGLGTAVAETAGLRLELARRSWIRLGRDVVGQRTEVVVARNRAGPSGRRATLRILYADGGERDACLRRDGLLTEPAAFVESALEAPVLLTFGNRTDATAPPLSTSSPPRPQPVSPGIHLVAGRADRPGRPALVGRVRLGRRSGRPGARRAARDGARLGSPAGAGGDVPRARAGG